MCSRNSTRWIWRGLHVYPYVFTKGNTGPLEVLVCAWFAQRGMRGKRNVCCTSKDSPPDRNFSRWIARGSPDGVHAEKREQQR